MHTDKHPKEHIERHVPPVRYYLSAPIRHYLPVLRVTGYDLTGRTASGAYVRPGICATDPRYIPMGVLITIPGVGTCQSEDTGVLGWWVDVWKATADECYRITGWYGGAYWTRPYG